MCIAETNGSKCREAEVDQVTWPPWEAFGNRGTRPGRGVRFRVMQNMIERVATLSAAEKDGR